MKINCKGAPKSFPPLEIVITLESKEEALNLLAYMNQDVATVKSNVFKENNLWTKEEMIQSVNSSMFRPTYEGVKNHLIKIKL